MELILSFAVSFLLCIVFTPIVRLIAVKKNWMDQPSADRWHKKPTARLGGIAIYIAVALPLFFIADINNLLSKIPYNGPQDFPAGVILIGITLLLILGLFDDFIKIKPHTKLVGQILVASLAAFLGFRLCWFTSMTLDTIITIVWIVGVTNAFNLIDNMDGLCAGIAAIAAFYLAFLFSVCSLQTGCIAAMLAGALTAFLFYNFNPASIFMGDCGSMGIGFTLSMLTLYYSGYHSTSGNALSAYAVPVMILMIPVLDTTLVTLIRLLSGRKASTGGKDHTSHRLVLIGFSEKGAVLFLYCIGAVSGIAAIFVSRNDTITSPAVIIPAALSILLMAVYLAQIRVYPEKEFSLLRGHVYTPILLELTYKKQILLVMLDFCLIAFSYYLAYRLRFDSDNFGIYFKVFLHSLPAVIACKFVAFFTFGVYRGIWRYMSTNDVFVYLKGSFFATALSVAAVTFIYRFEDFSKGIFVIDWMLTTGLLLGTRGSFRISLDMMKRKRLSGDNVLIYGAGRGGEILVREILHNSRHQIKPIGFIDDDPLKAGKKLQGYPILGSFKDVENLIDKHMIDGMLISFNHNNGKLDKVRKLCKTNHIFLKQFHIDLDEIKIEK